MVTTRRQSSANEGKAEPHHESTPKSHSARKNKASPKRRKQGKDKSKKTPEPEVGSKREANEIETHSDAEKAEKEEEPPKKKPKSEGQTSDAENQEAEKPKEVSEETLSQNHPMEHAYQTGTIERGHIYFFYRPKVELEEAHTLDDVQRFNILLVPRPPEFSTYSAEKEKANNADENEEMTLISSGSDVVPAAESTDEKEKPFRLIAVGKKSLPDPEAGGGGKGGGRKQVFWATITTVGDNLQKLEDGLGEKIYETKTKGTRHQGPSRLAARGAYAIVNSDARVPSDRETHLGYHLSHPTPEDFGEVQQVLGIHPASSFVIQVKNPLAPNTGTARVGLPSYRKAEFPKEIMDHVFGTNGGRGREDHGLRFASVERKEMLDYEGVELLFIAARSGEEGLESSLGEGRGAALKEVEDKEGEESIEKVLEELAMDAEKIPAEPLKGEWI